jgi:hypothetical protein
LTSTVPTARSLASAFSGIGWVTKIFGRISVTIR